MKHNLIKKTHKKSVWCLTIEYAYLAFKTKINKKKVINL